MNHPSVNPPPRLHLQRPARGPRPVQRVPSAAVAKPPPGRPEIKSTTPAPAPAKALGKAAAPAEELHPSWQAKRQTKAAVSISKSGTAVAGAKKVVFGDGAEPQILAAAPKPARPGQDARAGGVGRGDGRGFVSEGGRGGGRGRGFDGGRGMGFGRGGSQGGRGGFEGPGRGGRGGSIGGRVDGRSGHSGAVAGRGGRGGRGGFGGGVAEGPLHPSWEAKKKMAKALAHVPKAEGKKTVFE